MTKAETDIEYFSNYCLQLHYFLKGNRNEMFAEDGMYSYSVMKKTPIKYSLTPKQVARIKEEISRVEQYILLLRETANRQQGIPKLPTIADVKAYGESLVSLKFTPQD